jgi:hypothetical protein
MTLDLFIILQEYVGSDEHIECIVDTPLDVLLLLELFLFRYTFCRLFESSSRILLSFRSFIRISATFVYVVDRCSHTISFTFWLSTRKPNYNVIKGLRRLRENFYFWVITSWTATSFVIICFCWFLAVRNYYIICLYYFNWGLHISIFLLKNIITNLIVKIFIEKCLGFIIVKIIIIILIVIKKNILVRILNISFYQVKIIHIVTNLILKRIIFLILLLKALILENSIWSLHI